VLTLLLNRTEELNKSAVSHSSARLAVEPLQTDVMAIDPILGLQTRETGREAGFSGE
jgi:hypothetical protein